MKLHANVREGLSFDDVLVVPAHSEVYANDIGLVTRLAKGISLNIPIVSSGRESVTEAKMAIAIARQGGLGVIHRSMSIEAQATEVDKVKRCEHGVITDPIFISQNAYVKEAKALMAKYRISGVPVTENGKLIGILTNRDLRFETDQNKKVYEVMTKVGLITSHEGTSLEDAKQILAKHKIEKLPIVDVKMRLKGLITIKDIEKAIKYPDSSKDSLGRLLAAASIGPTGDFIERAAELIKNKADIIFMDAPHGYHYDVISAVAAFKERFDTPLVVGNVATSQAAIALAEAGADCIKVGMGSVSNSRTRVSAGVGIPQITSIADCFAVCSRLGVPIIADGGIRASGDITKALAAGAAAIMMGSMFVGCDESPGRVELYQGRKYKVYRSPGGFHNKAEVSNVALDLKQTPEDVSYLAGESVERRTPAKGSLADTVNQVLAGLRTGMAYAGCADISELHRKAEFIRITHAGLSENIEA